MIEILSSNRDLEEKVKEGEKILSVDIKRMPSYQIGLEHGMEKGMEKGKYLGKKEAKIEIAINLLDLLDSKTISQKTGVSFLKKDIPHCLQNS